MGDRLWTAANQLGAEPGTQAGAVLRWGRGGTGPPNVGQAPPNILVPTAKIRILKI